MSTKREPRPFYRKSKGAWYLQLGKRQISLGRDKKQAWARYHELMAINQPIQESATVEALLERYLDWVHEHRKPGTYEKVRHLLSRFSRYIGRKTTIGSICGADLTAWVESESTWNSTTRNDGIAAVIRCFNWAVGKRYLPVNNVRIVPDKPSRKRRETTFTPDDWQTLLSHVRDEAFLDLLTFMHETGCRPIEARTVAAEHLDLTRGLAIFPASEAKGGRHERVLYLNEVALDVCKRGISRCATGPLLRNTCGRPWTKDSVNCRFRRISKKLGKRAFAYAIRHSYATEGLVNGVDSVTLSQLMGHADVSTLAKNYAHLSKNPEFLIRQACRVRPDR